MAKKGMKDPGTDSLSELRTDAQTTEGDLTKGQRRRSGHEVRDENEPQ